MKGLRNVMNGMPHGSGRVTWSAAVMSVILILSTIVPAVAAPLGSDPAAAVPPDRFVDDDGSPHESDIDLIAAAGITGGCNPPANDRFCPDDEVDRGQMAAFLRRTLELQSTGVDFFRDDATSIFEGDIDAIAAAGITGGCNPPANDRFCPGGEVDRGQMAAFLRRALQLPSTDADFFADDATSIFEDDINAIAAAGITRGCNPPTNDRFCPTDRLTRAQTASMLVRALSYLAAPAAGGTSAPRTTTTTRPPGGGGSSPDYPGQAPEGTVLWGAAVGGNSDPAARHETPTGEALGIRRTFFQWKHITSGYLESIVKEDVARGRLPWISVKTPPWDEVASGSHDATIDQLLRMLDGVPGDVWLTFHHEPEGGGGVNAPDDPAGPSGHVAMNARVRERMSAVGVDNVALTLILMSWTWDPRSGRNPDEWWGPGVYDLLGVDHYACMDAEPSCIDDGLLDPVWLDIREWAGRRGVDVAVGEWGLRGSDQEAGNRIRQWYDHAIGSHSDGRGGRVVGLAAFDTDADTTLPSWELTGGQLEAFHELLKRSTSVRLND